ncbi:unnamed protein product [Fraxinus pennsylvanica]|uniref:DEAD-box RNA helicase Q domain-containing protein n=1 Tax=Fraxinus pennsylvanica TaxID=56036 RepID=A0AAD2AAC7_9LAMI|nr:unnamed protein product [Fraxinus pennsylvanica]
MMRGARGTESANGKDREEIRRAARGSEMGYGKDGGGGVGVKREWTRVSQRALVVIKDEEEEGDEEDYNNFKELTDSDEVDDEDEDESEEEDNIADDVFEKEKVLSQSPSSSLWRSDAYLSESRFVQCSISPLSMKGLKDAGYEKMTVVQEATLPVILEGLSTI